MNASIPSIDSGVRNWGMVKLSRVFHKGSKPQVSCFKSESSVKMLSGESLCTLRVTAFIPSLQVRGLSTGSDVIWECLLLFLTNTFAKSILLDFLQDSVCALCPYALCAMVTIWFLLRVCQASQLVITFVHRSIWGEFYFSRPKC